MAIDFLNKSSYIIYKWNIFHSYGKSPELAACDVYQLAIPSRRTTLAWLERKGTGGIVMFHWRI
jgi:hypothetical protein